VGTGINAITAPLAAGAAAIAIAAAPIASAEPSEQHCLEQQCLEAEAPTISPATGQRADPHLAQRHACGVPPQQQSQVARIGL
jgi:hypothetical protein